ncbi:MAG: TerB family tellurite resistance protein [Pseudomonadota bacterium]
MHILLAILGAAAAAFWAFKTFVDAAGEGREALRDAKGVLRKGKWDRRIDQRLIENLSDPREAAAILLYQTADYDGAVTQEQIDAIVEEMQIAFQSEEETAQALLAFARLAVGEINDAGNSLRKILTPINETCTTEEKLSLLRMLEHVAEIEAPMSEQQQRLIDETKHILEV